MDRGVDLPDGSGEPSDRIFAWVSNTPATFVLKDPTAGAAFWPSMLPICKRLDGRMVVEFAADSTDSEGLTGRSESVGDRGPVTEVDELEGIITGDRVLRGSRGD